TLQAERSLKEAKMNRKKRAQVVDRVSAVIILQNYLDQRGMRGG
ncbi:MAG: RuvX/YqgF family protein, partial [Chlamydiia bacterium]|nr:RuvX/YqgF family protein [Chlamydiia bacterium]